MCMCVSVHIHLYLHTLPFILCRNRSSSEDSDNGDPYSWQEERRKIKSSLANIEPTTCSSTTDKGIQSIISYGITYSVRLLLLTMSYTVRIEHVIYILLYSYTHYCEP